MLVEWSDAAGTRDYRGYTRSHTISAHGKPVLEASSDPAFRGDASRYNPEELLVAAISSCHMLWFLHLCADRGVVVTAYRDAPVGEMQLNADGSGQFTRVTLHPQVEIADGSRLASLAPDHDGVGELHREAHRLCFIARSVNFPVEIS